MKINKIKNKKEQFYFTCLYVSSFVDANFVNLCREI